MLIEAILCLVIIKLTTQVKSKSLNFEFKLHPLLTDNSVYWLHFNTPFLYVIYKCTLLIYITLTQVDSIVYNTHDFDYFCVCDSINQFCWNQYFQQPFSLTFNIHTITHSLVIPLNILKENSKKTYVKRVQRCWDIQSFMKVQYLDIYIYSLHTHNTSPALSVRKLKRL